MASPSNSDRIIMMQAAYRDATERAARWERDGNSELARRYEQYAAGIRQTLIDLAALVEA